MLRIVGRSASARLLLRPRTSVAAAGPRHYTSSAAAAYAVTPYRAMADATDAQRAAWATQDEVLHARMRELVPAALKHNGEEAFDDHLIGVQSVLRSWGASETLCNAALFHSIYGTEGFQGYKLPLSHRAEVAGLIGADAERLAWIFCMVDRATVDATVLPAPRPGASFYARPDLGRFEITLRGEKEWLAFLTLSLADWLEQVYRQALLSQPTPQTRQTPKPTPFTCGYKRHS